MLWCGCGRRHSPCENAFRRRLPPEIPPPLSLDPCLPSRRRLRCCAVSPPLVSVGIVAVRVAESWSSSPAGPRGWRALGRGACSAPGRARETRGGGGSMAPMPPLSGLSAGDSAGSHLRHRGGSPPASSAAPRAVPTSSSGSSLVLRGVLTASSAGRYFAWNPSNGTVSFAL